MLEKTILIIVITSVMEVPLSFVNESSNGSSDSAVEDFSQWRLTTAITLVNRLAHQYQSLSSSIYPSLIMDMLYYAFQPFNFATLGVFQLLIIKRKKHLVTHKTISFSIFIPTVITVFISLP